MEIIDTHAHLDLPQFAGDDCVVIDRARKAGVTRIICVGTSLEATEDCIALARLHPGCVFATAGIHPNYSVETPEGAAERLAELARRPEVVAVGETGLDYYWDFSPPEAQRRWLRIHLRLARETGKPLVLHVRKADEDALELLTAEAESGPLRGVRHCFDRDRATAEAYVALGLHIAVGGTVTQDGHKKLKAAVAALPADRILLETDCPYMLPAGLPKGRNEPEHIVRVLEAVAEVRGQAPEEVARQTTLNARRLFFSAAPEDGP